MIGKALTDLPDANTHVTIGGADTDTILLKVRNYSNANIFSVLGSGNVGIGTTSPDHLLHVSGNAKMSNIYLLGNIIHEGDVDTQIKFATDTIAFDTAGSERLTINSTGNVGIGTTSPSEKLEVSGNIKTTGNVTFDGGAGTLNGLRTINRTGEIRINTTQGTRFGETALSSGQVIVDIIGKDDRIPLGIKQQAGTSQTRFVTFLSSSGDEVLGITTDGGFTTTDSTLVKRYVFEHGYAPSPADGMGIGLDLKVENASGTITSVGFIDVIQDDVSEDESSMRLSVGETTPTEVMRLQSDGNVGIGTSSPTPNAGNMGVHIKAPTNVSSELKLDTTDSNRGNYITFAKAGVDKWDIYSPADGSLRFRDKTLPEVTTPLTLLDGGNVGINTTTPTALLEVKGSGSASTDTHFRVVEAAGTGNLFRVNQRETIARFLTGSDGILLPTNQPVNYGSSTVYTKRDSTLNAFVYSQGGTEHFAIKDGGNVGIGTTTPAATLHIKSPSNFTNTGSLQIDTTGVSSTQVFMDLKGTAGGDQYIFKHYRAGTLQSWMRNDQGRTQFNTTPLPSYLNSTAYTFNVPSNVTGNLFSVAHNFNNKFIISASGDTTVVGDLTVEGKVIAQEFHTEFVSASIVYSSGSTKFGDTLDDIHQFTGSIELSGSQGIVRIGNPTEANFNQIYLYRPGNRSAITIDTDAGRSATLNFAQGGVEQFKVGMPIQDVGSLGQRFAISYQGNPNFVMDADGIAINKVNPEYDLDVSGSGRFTNDLTVTGSLDVNGTVQATAFVETSARRFKENIEPIEGALNKVINLQGVTFNRIGEEKHEYGFIADEVKGIVPELVTHNAEGEIQGVHYARTVAVLTEAIKELDNKVKAQDLFINDLVARIEKLENK